MKKKVGKRLVTLSTGSVVRILGVPERAEARFWDAPLNAVPRADAWFWTCGCAAEPVGPGRFSVASCQTHLESLQHRFERKSQRKQSIAASSLPRIVLG
jgi:hypothetical protein